MNVDKLLQEIARVVKIGIEAGCAATREEVLVLAVVKQTEQIAELEARVELLEKRYEDLRSDVGRDP